MIEQYVKIPVLIDAVLFSRENHDIILEWLGDKCENLRIPKCIGCKATLQIKTLEGTMLATEGDYIIRGIKGEFYPCNAEIFELTYNKYSKVGEL